MIEKFNVKYPKGVPFLEDGLFLIKAFAVAERVGFSHERFYQRTTRTASATGSGTFYSQRAIDGFLKSAADIREFGQTHNFNATQQGMVNHGIANFVLLAIFPLVSFHKLERFKVIKKIKELGFSKLETTGVVDPYLTYARYFNFSPYLMMVVYAMQMAVRKFKLKTIGN